VCRSTSRGSASLSRIIEHEDLISGYVLYLFDFDVLFEFHYALRIIRIDLLHFLEFLLPLVLRFDVTKVVENIP
jgi:hypothetical protein